MKPLDISGEINGNIRDKCPMSLNQKIRIKIRILGNFREA
jgi:hypothetical protein